MRGATERQEVAASASVIVGMSGATGLAVVRALAPQGVACHVVHYDASAPGMATRLARRSVCPDWRREPEAFVDFLLGVGRPEGGEASAGTGLASLFAKRLADRAGSR